MGEAHGSEDWIDGGSSLLVGVGVADCDAPQSQRHRTFQETAQPRKDCVHARGKIARGDIGRANERAPRPMLPPTRAHASDSRTFGPQFVELPPPWPVGLLNRPIDTATEFAARGPDRPTARPKRSTRRKRSLAAPACRSHALHANRCTAHDRRGRGTAADRRFRDRNTFGKDSA